VTDQCGIDDDSVCLLAALHILDGLGVSTAKFWPFFRCRNASASRGPPPLTSGSAPGPRWELAPVKGSRFALAMYPSPCPSLENISRAPINAAYVRDGWLFRAVPVPKRSYYDKFLAFPPEYVALLGLGILFIILFIIVVIIICVTARVRQSSSLTMVPPASLTLRPRPNTHMYTDN